MFTNAALECRGLQISEEKPPTALTAILNPDAHPAFYSMRNGCSLQQGKTTGASSWTLNFIERRVQALMLSTETIYPFTYLIVPFCDIELDPPEVVLFIHSV